jgi:hypothetical protein
MPADGQDIWEDPGELRVAAARNSLGQPKPMDAETDKAPLEQEALSICS